MEKCSIRSESVVGSHLIDGEFQSDKYPTTPRGKVPLSVKDATAQDLLWKYAQRRRSVDAQFSDDLESALRTAGYAPGAGGVHTLETIAGYQKRAEAAEAGFATRDAEIGRLIEERNALRDAFHRQNMCIEQMVTRDHVGECVEVAVAKEREACAQACVAHGLGRFGLPTTTADDYAAAVRARSKPAAVEPQLDSATLAVIYGPELPDSRDTRVVDLEAKLVETERSLALSRKLEAAEADLARAAQIIRSLLISGEPLTNAERAYGLVVAERLNTTKGTF